MKNIKRFDLNIKKGVTESKEGKFVTFEDYDKLNDYLEEVMELAHNYCVGLGHDDLHDIINKYEY
jgi:hypothetical protein